MGNGSGYAVYFFPQALEALGEAIKPYLVDGPAGLHVLCHAIDTAGALVEMTLRGKDATGAPVELELMIPSGMVRMVVSAHSDELFGFGARASGSATPRTGGDASAHPVTQGDGGATREGDGRLVP